MADIARVQSTLNFQVRKTRIGGDGATPVNVNKTKHCVGRKWLKGTTTPPPDKRQPVILGCSSWRPLSSSSSSEEDQESPKKRRSPWTRGASKNESTDENSRSALTSPPRGKDERRPPVCRSLLPVQLFNQDVSVYQSVKSVLVATGSNVPLPGREKEIAEMTNFLDEHLLTHQRPGSLYISGAPGTGKTACLNQILQAIKKSSHNTVMINCMTLRVVNAVYERIYGELCRKQYRPPCSSSLSSTVASMQKKLKHLMTTGERMTLLILDEIDYLDSKDQEILYTIFEWPALKNSTLVLIGIANALDLTDRVLPRLQGHFNCRPRLLHFAPYSYDQCLLILRSRLQQVSGDGNSVFKAAALQFCARKVASVSGDIRKALDVCRRAVELVEADVRKQKILQPRRIQNGDECSKDNALLATVELGLIVSILNDVYGNTLAKQMQNGDSGGGGTDDDDDSGGSQSLPLHQKVLLCTLLLIIRKGKSKEVTIGKFHETYCRVCKTRQLSYLEQSDFSNVCGLVESRGLIAIKTNKNYRLSKVTLKVDENEIEFSVRDRTLLASILQDNGCL